MIRRSLRALSTLIICVRGLLSQISCGASVLCLNPAGEVLLVRTRLAPGWMLPGGAVDAGEHPVEAALRELHEEAGHSGGGPPELFGIYVRRVLWVTNIITVYRLQAGQVAFAPNWEIADICWADPASPPPGTHAGVRRRLAELVGAAPKQLRW